MVTAEELDVVGVVRETAPRVRDDVIVVELLPGTAHAALTLIAHSYGNLYVLRDGSRRFSNGHT